MKRSSGVAAFLPLMLGGLFSAPVAREVDFDSDVERIISADEANRRNREKFPSRKKRLRLRGPK